MASEEHEMAQMMRVYHQVESAAKDFLFISASAMKNKEHAVKSAQATLRTLENYKKLPLEIRKELEKDKSSHVSKIVELEKLCKEVLLKYA